MKKLVMAITLVSLLVANESLVGNYRLTGLNVTYYDVAREATDVNVVDSYGLMQMLQADPLTLQTIAAGEMFYATFNGPHPEAYLQAINVNLNINMYSDGSGEIIEGSFYPDVEEEDCVTSVQVLPITDDLSYGEIPEADLVNPGINLIGLPSQTTFAGQGGFGGIGLSQSVIFDYFPAVPTQTSIPFDVNYGDLNGNGEIDYGVWPQTEGIEAGTTLPGFAMGLFRKTGETEASFVEGNTPRDLYLEWHAIDGEVSQSGLGDIIGEDEDGDGTDYDRIFGLPYITQTCIDPAVGLGLNHCIFGGSDVADGFIANGVPASLITETVGTDGYVMDPSGDLAPWNNYLTYNGFAWDFCLGNVIDGVEAQCEAAGSPVAAVTGLCVEASQSDDFAAACAYYGPAAALVATCESLGFPTETCAEAAAQAAPAIDGYCLYAFGVDCETAGVDPCAILTDVTFATGLCSTLAGGLTESETCEEWANSFDNDFLDEIAANQLGASCTDLFGANDSGHDFDFENDFTFLDGNGAPCSPLDGDPTCVTPYSANGGRLVMHFDATCVPEIEVREVMVEFVEVGDGGGCTDANGDANQDGQLSVLDVVVTINHILNVASLDEDGLCAADISGDGVVNVLDVVQIVNTILAPKANNNSATSAELIKSANGLSYKSNGTVGGFEITIEHGDSFAIDLTDSAQFAEHNTIGNVTKVVIINPDSDQLFSTNGPFEIKEVIAATTAGLVDTSVSTPTSFVISSAYPNPFNPTTTFDISLGVSSDVSVKVYNSMGQLVDVLAEGNMASGTYTLAWDASSLSSGVYFIKSQVGSLIDNQKVMLLK